MNHHTFDPASAAKLEDVGRYRFCSREELIEAIDPAPDAEVVDLGSGTGFYTRDVAGFVGQVHAIDVQPAMHEHFRTAGVPENVVQVTAEVADIPLDDATVDAAYSTMTFHEFATDDALAEVRRVLRPAGRFVVVDWSAEGIGEDGPPLEARYGPDGAASAIEAAGFDVARAEGRPETFLVVATAP